MNRFLRWLREPETIGAPDCPIIRRWTIVDEKAEATASHDQQVTTLLPLPKWLTRDRKLMVHFFPANVEDRDPHDHPRGFWTIVLRGRYLDLVPCQQCGGRGDVAAITGIAGIEENGEYPRIDAWRQTCPACRGQKVVIGEVMKRGMVRYRPPEHTHITQSGPEGAWTIVLMGPQARDWGFWRGGVWWAWRKYEDRFGFAHRCPSDEELEGAMLKYSDAMVGENPPVVYKHAPTGVSTLLHRLGGEKTR